MNDVTRPHVCLEQLRRPADAALYIWAPTGDIAFAKAARSVNDGVREASSKGWHTFKWALPLETSLDYMPTGENEAVMMPATITVGVQRFEHERHPGAFAARFMCLADQNLYLTRLPHLAIAEGEQP